MIAILVFTALYFLPNAISAGLSGVFIYGIGLLFYIWIGSLLVMGVKAIFQRFKK
jgi:hypothetical protein